MSDTFGLAPNPVQQFFTNQGSLAAGGLIFTYAAGTTNKQNAYTDSTGDTPLPNPITLNARGEIAPSAVGTSCGLWLQQGLAYKIVYAPAGDTDPPSDPIWTVDEIEVPTPYTPPTSAYAYYTNQPSAPAASLSSVGVMMGLAGAITPNITGKVLFIIQGSILNVASGDYAAVGVRYGTGAAPTNGAALTGLPAAPNETVLTATANQTVPFNNQGLAVGLTVGTAYWFDASLAIGTGGTAEISQLNLIALELP